MRTESKIAIAPLDSYEIIHPGNGLVKIEPSKMIPDQLGIEAVVAIEPGQTIFKITGPILPHPTRYTFQIGSDRHLNPIENGEPSYGHFTNHSCDPSAFIRISPNADEIVVLARRKIKPGEEVTVDYSAMEYAPVATGIECKCGSNNCRGIITGYKDLSSDIKRRYIAEGIVPLYLIELDSIKGQLP